MHRAQTEAEEAPPENMSFGKKKLDGLDHRKLQNLTPEEMVRLTEQFILDRLNGRWNCPYCKQALDKEPSCPKCIIFKRT